MDAESDPHSTSFFKNGDGALPSNSERTAAVPPPTIVPVLKRRKVGEILNHMGYLQAEQLELAAGQARASGMRLGQFLVRAGAVSPDVVCRALALQSGLPVTQITEAEIPDHLGVIFPPDVLKRFGVVPFDDNKEMVCIAAFNPLPAEAIGELQRVCCRKVEVFLAREDHVLTLLDSVCRKYEKKPRKHVRYDVRVPVRYGFCNRIGNAVEDAFYSGMMINVSEGGMLLEGQPVSLGSLEELRRRGICVSLAACPGPDEMRALCQIRALRPYKQPDGLEVCQLGLEIVEMSVDDRRRLKELSIKKVLTAVRTRSRRPFL